MPRLLGAAFLFVLALSSLALPQDASQTPLDVPSETQSGSVVKKVPPVYPPLARQARIQGTVQMRVVISQSGDVVNVQLISGHPMLAPAAIAAVKQWQYKPYLVDGNPVEVQTEVKVNFALSEPSAPEGIAGDAPGGLPPEATGSVADSGSAVRVPEAVMRTFRIVNINPLFPPLALQARIEGAVALAVRISQSGDPEQISLISGHPLLAPAAIEAVKQWKYRPYELNGASVPVDTTVTLKFEMTGEQTGTVRDLPIASPSMPSEGPVSSMTGPVPRIATPQRVRVSSGVAAGLVVSKMPPTYPSDAREQHIQGTVLLQATIDKEGNVADLQLISGDPILAEAAIDAVKQWKYQPYLLNGTAVEMETQIRVNFTLRE